MKVKIHKDSFDKLYASQRSGQKDREVKFPLRDIGKTDKAGKEDQFRSYFYKRFSVHILSKLKLEAGQRILIVGCGRGFDEKNIKTLCDDCETWSIDISEEMVNMAVEGGSPSHFAVSIAERLPFPDNCFDRVLSREVIEHVIEPGEMMKEVSRVLKPGGLAVITTENDEAIGLMRYLEKIRPGIARILKYDLPALTYKDEAPGLEEMKSYVRNAGLTVKEIIYDGALYKLLYALRSVLRSGYLIKAAHYFSSLENNSFLARYYCDQVKYVLKKSKNTEIDKRATPRPVYICVDCKGELERNEKTLFCKACNESYNVVDDIPLLIVDKEGADMDAFTENNIEKKDQVVCGVFSRAAYKVIDWIFLAGYLAIYVFSALLAAVFIEKNSKQLSHLIDKDDPYQKYLMKL